MIHGIDPMTAASQSSTQTQTGPQGREERWGGWRPASIFCEGLRVTFNGSSLLPLTKGRTCVKALDGVSFSVQAGEIFGVLGPNGSGKTTLMKILSTIILPASGEIRVGGFDIYTDADKIRGLIGLAAGSERSFYYRLTGEQNLRFFAAAQGMKPRTARERISDLLDCFGLGDAGDKMYMTYSTGMRRKLLITRALLHNPSIILLDEPTASLDPISAKNLRELIKELNREGKTIVLSTHYLQEAEELCQNVILLKQGCVIASGRPQDLVSSIGQGDILKLTVQGFDEKVSESIKEETNSTLLKIDYIDPPIGLAELTFLHKNRSGQDYLTNLVRALANHGAKIMQFHQKEPTLEDAFLQLAQDTEKEKEKVGEPA